MMKEYLIGTDIGTSGTKSVLIDSKGHILSEALKEYSILTPKPVWAEQWSSVWIDAVYSTIKETIEKSNIAANNIAGVCISGLYGGSGIPLDENYNPVRPCIIWMDRRAVDECEEIEKKIGTDKLFEITGNGIDPYFGFSKILWIKNNEPENWEKIKLFLPPHSYVIYKMTGIISIDYTSAGNLGGIYDLKNNAWSVELMEEMGIPESIMPTSFKLPEEMVGKSSKQVEEEIGLPEGTPIFAGCIDCLASSLAAGAIEAGQHVAVIGTSINWGVVHRNYPTNKAYITMPYAVDPKNMYYTYGGASTAGALPKWFKDNFASCMLNENGEFVDSTYDMLNAEAEAIEIGSEGLIILPYFMGERSPIWDPDARGTIFGLTLKHTRAHVYRAILESVAYALKHIIETSKFDVDKESKCFLIGGVTRSKLWKQIFADVTGITMVCSKDNIQAPVGDALIAGIGTGIIEDYSKIKEWIDFSEVIKPHVEAKKKYEKYFVEYKQLYLSLKDNMGRLSKIEKV